MPNDFIFRNISNAQTPIITRYSTGNISVLKRNNTQSPPATRLMFSTFRTQGNTTTAFRDTDKFTVNAFGTGQESGVVSAVSLGISDWPTTNIFQGRVHTSSAWPTVTVQYNWGAPIVGEIRYLRFYLQVRFPNTLTPDATEGNLIHGIETADAETGGGDGYAFMILPKTDGTFFVGFRDVAGHRFYCDNTFFNKNTTYRVEIKREFTTSTSYIATVRIYDASGTLLTDSGNSAVGGNNWTQYLPTNNPSIYMRDTPITSTLIAHTVERFGNNGPGTNFPGTSTYGTQATVVEGEDWYSFGAIALGTQDWLGAYDAVLEPDS